MEKASLKKERLLFIKNIGDIDYNKQYLKFIYILKLLQYSM